MAVFNIKLKTLSAQIVISLYTKLVSKMLYSGQR